MQQSICPKFEKATKILGKRWVGLIIYQLMPGPKRFNTLETEIKISAKVLSERLKELELEGLVVREVYPETPVRIEYRLTEKGHSLKPIMDAIASWSHDWVK